MAGVVEVGRQRAVGGGIDLVDSSEFVGAGSGGCLKSAVASAKHDARLVGETRHGETDQQGLRWHSTVTGEELRHGDTVAPGEDALVAQATEQSADAQQFGGSTQQQPVCIGVSTQR